MCDRRETSDDDIVHALLVQDLADPNGVEHQSLGRRSEACADCWIANMTLEASTIVLTRSATDIHNCLRICPMSTPRSSSMTAISCIAPVYADRQPRLRSVTRPPLASTNLCGSMPNTSCHVPAAAHTSSYCRRSGSMKTRSVDVCPNGGTPPIGKPVA